MGLVQKPNFDFYWSNDSLFKTPIFHRLMSRTRFRAIRSIIHFSDCVTFDDDDTLHKLRYFIDKLGVNFMNNYTPDQNVAIDEYLSLWKGRLSFKIYIPSKRERYRIKLYMLCESDSRYLSKFITYTGSTTNTKHATKHYSKIWLTIKHHHK